MGTMREIVLLDDFRMLARHPQRDPSGLWRV